MAELSVIVPFCNEYPQVLFTIQSIAQELRDRVDFEIIAVDNYCDEVAKQGRERDGGGGAIEACTRGNPWLKYTQYTKKLSHWQAKNHGVRNCSTGRFLWFCDAHCMLSRDSLFYMMKAYRECHEQLNGTLHLPLTYKILEWHRLIYRLVEDLDHGIIEYRFTNMPAMEDQTGITNYFLKAPCMSTCGMMMTRELYDALGGWPDELGIYGGGEHFINFSLAVMGKTVNVFNTTPLFHHGEKRGYSWNYNDYTRNRTIASYMFGGKALARKYIKHRKGDSKINNGIFLDVLDKCAGHRAHIRSRQMTSIEDWVVAWKMPN